MQAVKVAYSGTEAYAADWERVNAVSRRTALPEAKPPKHFMLFPAKGA